MPEVGKQIIKHIVLPEYPEDDPAYVDVICNPKRDVFLDMNGAQSDDVDSFMLSKIIVDWNFTKDNKKIEINEQNIKTALSMIDTVLIFKEIGLDSLFTEVKKNNSRSISLPKTEPPLGNTLI